MNRQKSIKVRLTESEYELLKSRQTAVQWPAICVAFVLVILKHLQKYPKYSSAIT